MAKNPSELLAACQVDASLGADVQHRLVKRILALMVTRLNQTPTELITEVESIIRAAGTSVSIGKALDRLADVANYNEGDFESDGDGLDALCHHLSADQCHKGIDALQRVLKRFEGGLTTAG